MSITDPIQVRHSSIGAVRPGARSQASYCLCEDHRSEVRIKMRVLSIWDAYRRIFCRYRLAAGLNPEFVILFITDLGMLPMLP